MSTRGLPFFLEASPSPICPAWVLPMSPPPLAFHPHPQSLQSERHLPTSLADPMDCPFPHPLSPFTQPGREGREAHICSRQTVGSDTWWPQTCPQSSHLRWGRGWFHSPPCTVGTLQRDLGRDAAVRVLIPTPLWRPRSACFPVQEIHPCQDLMD